MDGLRHEKKNIQKARKINKTSKSLVERLDDFKIYALSVLGTNICLVSAGYIGSISALGEATLK